MKSLHNSTSNGQCNVQLFGKMKCCLPHASLYRHLENEIVKYFLDLTHLIKRKEEAHLSTKFLRRLPRGRKVNHHLIIHLIIIDNEQYCSFLLHLLRYSSTVIISFYLFFNFLCRPHTHTQCILFFSLFFDGLLNRGLSSIYNSEVQTPYD